MNLRSFEGRSVLVEGHQRLIAPWSERVRYGIKKNGYHGGLSPQEMVVPIVVLSNTDNPTPPGGRYNRSTFPLWWVSRSSPPGPAEQPVPALKPAIPRTTRHALRPATARGDKTRAGRNRAQRRSTFPLDQPAAWVASIL